MGKCHRWPIHWRHGLTRRGTDWSRLLAVLVNRDPFVVLTLLASDGEYFPVSLLDLPLLTISSISEAAGAQFCLADFLQPNLAILYQRAVETFVLGTSRAEGSTSTFSMLLISVQTLISFCKFNPFSLLVKTTLMSMTGFS